MFNRIRALLTWLTTATLMAAGLTILGPSAPASASLGPSAPASASLGPSAPASAATLADAYANQGANACSWTIGTSGIQETLGFSSGNYQVTSVLNKLPATAVEYSQGAAAKGDFQLSWDGSTLNSGTSGGWTCVSGSTSTVTVGGLAVLQLDVTLTHATDLKVIRHYQIFPSESIIRSWSDITNTGSSLTHTLSAPSVAQQNLMNTDIAAGNVQLQYMTGAKCCTDGTSWTLRTPTMTSSYARTFDSYDPFGCVESGNIPPVCVPRGFSESSTDYIPWFGYFNTAGSHGIVTSFDYMGHWQAPIGAFGSGGSLSVQLAAGDYSSALVPGGTVSTPQATTMTYKTDLDDMTNRLLDYQYRYLWDYTRTGYFATVQAPGDWCTGTQWCSQWDQQGIRQKIYNLSDRERAIGVDVDWRDNGWWDKPGDWNGPDFKLTHDMLAKSGIKQVIYYQAYGANTNSAAYAAHPAWFTNSSPCGYTDRLGDLSIPAFEAYVQNLLISRAQNQGDYEWRNDACPVTATTGSAQLSQDQAYRRVLKAFLDQQPGSAYYAVDSGGNEIGLDHVRMASAINFYDGTGINNTGTSAFYDASRLFPTDKLSGDPNNWSSQGYCSRLPWRDLAMNLSFYSSAYPIQPWHADTTDPTQLECARQLIDTYHYMVAKGVAGRWVRQYHPTSSDAAKNWFERLSADGNTSTIHRIGTDASGSVTVYPKALNAATIYDVRFQFDTKSPVNRTGSDLMLNGVTFPAGVSQGEIIYLNLPQHPGSTADTTAPQRPSSVTAVASTDVNYPDVIVKWQPATDNNWVSYYNVYRNNVYIGRATKTSYLDHTPGASSNAVYGVQAVDGAGNISKIMKSVPPHGPDSYAVDDSTGNLINYSSSGSCTTPSTSPVGEWRLGDPPGSTTAADSSGNGNSGTVHGAVSFGQPGALASEPTHTAASFDGTSGFIDLGNPNALKNNSGSITAWIKTTSTDSGYHAIAIKWYAYDLFVQNGDLVTYDWANNTEHDTGIKVADGNWHHVALSYQSGVTNGTTLYVDGHQAGPAITITIANQNSDALIGSGANFGVELFNGTIDDVAFYAQPLTAANVAAEYASGGYALTFPGYPVPCWQHQTGVAGAFDATLSTSSNPNATATYTFTGSAVTGYFQMAPDEGTVHITVDGTSSTLDLYAPDALNYSVPLFTREWPSPAQHTITITPTGAKNSKASGTAVRLDGLQVQTTAKVLIDNSAFSYSPGWSSACSGCDAIDGTLQQSSTLGATATITINTSRVQLIGNYCSSCGEADITVDGKFDARIDTYGDRGAAQTHAVLYDKSWPTSGSHTITITVDGTHNLDSTGSTVTLDAALLDNGHTGHDL